MTFRGEDGDIPMGSFGGNMSIVRKNSVVIKKKEEPYKSVEPFKSKFVMNDISFVD